MASLLIQNGTVIRSSGEEKADISIEDGVIRFIGKHERGFPPDKIIDASGMLIFPRLIDCHAHFREPGLTHKADMKSESAAAKAGGIGTVCEMPNTIPPTTTIAALADKVRRAAEISDVDIRFFFGITEAAHLTAFKELWTGTSDELKRLKARCCGVKLYLDHSTGNQKVEAEILEEVFQAAGDLGFPVVCHCEDPELNEKARAIHSPHGKGPALLHSQLRPPESEAKAIGFAIGLARQHRTALHVAHLSTKQGIDLVRQAKKDALQVTCDVTPHHLFLSTLDYEEQSPLGTLAKVNPPLRSMDHGDALWKGIADRTVDCIASDHAPHTLEEKNGENQLEAPSGVPGVETLFPLLLSVAAGKWPHPSQSSAIRLQVSDIVRLCFENPNRIFALGKKGIAEGAPPAFIFVDPEKPWVIRGAELHSKCGWTPYEGWKIRGKIVEPDRSGSLR